MSFYLDKSEQNKRAGDFFISHREHSCWAPVIHCSYYACTLLLLHRLIHFKHYTRDEIEKETGARNRGTNKTLLYLGELVIAKSKVTDIASYNSDFGELQDLREESDYFNVESDEKIAKRSVDLRNRITALIKNNIK